MSAASPAPPGWWGTVRRLLQAVRLRAKGRRQRQRELTRSRTGGRSFGGSGLGTVVIVMVALGINLSAAYVVAGAARVGQHVIVQQQGLVAADRWFIDRVDEAKQVGMRFGTWPQSALTALREALDQEAAELAGPDPTRRSAARQVLLTAVQDRGAAGLVSLDETVRGLTTGLPAVLASLAVLAWLAGLVCSGEGLEVDVGRRRHPMWEWLLSHPVPPSAVFAAEMLAPIAANPLFWTAPLVPGLLYGQVYGAWQGVLAVGLVGIPVALAAACVSKAVEVAVILRAPARSRGAMIGIMTWLGGVASALLVMVAFTLDDTVRVIAGLLHPWADLPWLGWPLMLASGGGASFLSGVAACLAASVLAMVAAVASTAWSTRYGLAGRTGWHDVAPARQARFGHRTPLLRKELVWFLRDRSALVQLILVPAGAVGMQLFYLHGLLAQVRTGWQAMCGAGILGGTYFLLIVGPRSLASEGGTLWLAMTWPHGMERLLRAKARFLAALASIPAGLAMGYAAWLFPGDWWEIALVALGWVVFADSTAAKAVTLARVTSDSGETEKIPAGRRWAVRLGVFSFTIGVLTLQVGLAVAGIVFSVATAAACWQNFRARLPFLLDPWSERLPKPPTLMHAMVAISALVEVGAVLHGILTVALGRDAAQAGFAASYGIAAIGVSIGTASFLARRDVAMSSLWTWARAGRGMCGSRQVRAWAPSLLMGVGAGLGLGLLGCCYLVVLDHLPWTAEALRQVQEATARVPGAGVSFFLAAVLFAPAAEEFLFRGLLFRGLDRDWKGWRAVLGSAVFFASYHPVLAWLPVCAVGAACAVLFKRTGRLATSVALHVTYNAVVLGWQL